MCAISGVFSLNGIENKNIKKWLEVMNELQAHRGPDGDGIWKNERNTIGFAHRRLSIIDLSDFGKQPMQDTNGNWICFNGEIYNYIELKQELGDVFKTNSDTEVILKSYKKWGINCVNHFNGMFAFAIWDEHQQKLFCARDRFGIKPFYYTIVDGYFLFASEIKALLPFLAQIETDVDSLKEYITFQFCMEGKTLFKDVNELEAAHFIEISEGRLNIERYWQVYYNLDWDHTEKYFVEKLDNLIHNSVKYHVRSDVPIGAYVSGGIDSSIVASLACGFTDDSFVGFTGKFSIGKEYDESEYARLVAEENKFKLLEIDINSTDFLNHIEKVIYHLDTPVAGPGSFCQYMTSKLVSENCKVVLGGQGGDEVFGGYTRYLVAYFEQCIKGAIDGTMNDGNFVLNYESIIPNLVSLKNYKPMLKEFWSDGLFDDINKRYFKLINRAPQSMDCIRKEMLDEYSPFDTFNKIFKATNVNKESYFDRMTHFDFKTLLPALLQVEDRMSMAHGIESRVPFLDHETIEFAATIPANFKLKNGDLKYILKQSMKAYIPSSVLHRKDKMGFPVPFNHWLKNDIKEYVYDIFTSQNARSRELIDNKIVLDKIEKEHKFGRNIWGFLSLELWQRQFHDQRQKYRNMLK